MDTTEQEDRRGDDEAGSIDRYRWSNNHSASASAMSLRSSLPAETRTWHRATITSAFLLALLLFLSSCSQASGPVIGRVTATPSVVPTPTPTPYVSPPTPIPPPVGLPPRDCHPEPTPRPIFSDVGPGYGSFPVWAFDLDTTVRIATSYFTYTQYGWEWKVLWRVSTRFTQLVQLHGGDLRTSTPLWFQIGDQAPITAPVLDPRPRELQIAQSGSPADTVGWGSYLLLPTAGCYYVEASWPGGSWRVTFAAGRL